jgi:hypothetical protein
MKYLKMLGLAAFAAMAFTAFVGASTASATTLEVTGVTQAQPVTITASLTAGTSAILRDTFGFAANTCKESHVHGSTVSPYTGTTVTGEFTAGEAGLSFKGCTNPVTVHKSGKLHVEWEDETDGWVSSSEAEVTVWSTIHGTYINCKTGPGVVIGTLTGVTHGHAEIHINTVLDCSPHLSSAKWIGAYIVTTPTGLGVSA